MNPQTYIFYGRSGCGKGTQAHLLREVLEAKGGKVVYIETGTELRAFASRDNYTSKLTKQVMDSGGLLPAFIPVFTWTNRMIESFSGTEHLILDGLARKPNESSVLDSAISFYKRERPYVILMNVSEKWSREKLVARGRKDDSNDLYIQSRLDWYERDVVPAIEFFRNHSGYHFVEVNGEDTIENVHAELIGKLNLN